MDSADASIKNATVPRPKVYIDADVLLAAAVSTRGASHIIVKLSELTLIEGVISEAVQIEVERNLRAKLPAALPAYRALVDSAKLQIVPLPTVEQLQAYQGQANEKDLPHLAAACLAGCQYLVTHNTRDYFPKPGPLEVLKPGAFLERVRAQLARLIP
ncbi:MAG: PIN domain-containing protein [Clostridia bacterium]|nr:PIN domain-containing protein [Clostridia bacterium]